MGSNDTWTHFSYQPLIISCKLKTKNNSAPYLTDIELGVGEKLDKRGDDVRLDHGLDLFFVTSGDVRDGPARLLTDALL